MLSICIIGSQARDTADMLSDMDVLLVAQPSTALDRAMANWRSEGWNVSVFDRPAFGRLAEVRSLFVQHVKLEGRIVRDDGGFLSATLKSYAPKASYLGERNDALRQLAALPDAKGHYWHDLCLADITYVLFRNAAILHLASIACYRFGFEQLVDAVAAEFGLCTQEREVLIGLRELKHGYRQRLDGLDRVARISDARQAISRIASILGDLGPSSVGAGITTEDYFHQRLEELHLAWRFSPPVLDGLGPEHELFGRWQRIKGTSGYPKDRPRLH